MWHLTEISFVIPDARVKRLCKTVVFYPQKKVQDILTRKSKGEYPWMRTYRMVHYKAKSLQKAEYTMYIATDLEAPVYHYYEIFVNKLNDRPEIQEVKYDLRYKSDPIPVKNVYDEANNTVEVPLQIYFNPGYEPRIESGTESVIQEVNRDDENVELNVEENEKDHSQYKELNLL